MHWRDSEGTFAVQVWDNNHNRDFHTLVEKDVDREAFEEETYKRLLAESLDHDTESANRAGVNPGCTSICTCRHICHVCTPAATELAIPHPTCIYSASVIMENPWSRGLLF